MALRLPAHVCVHAPCQSRLGFSPGHFSRKPRGKRPNNFYWVLREGSELLLVFLIRWWLGLPSVLWNLNSACPTTSGRKLPLPQQDSLPISSDQAPAEAGSGFGRVANRLNVEGISSSPLLLPTSFSGKIWINKNTGQVACCSPWRFRKLSSLCDPRSGWLVIFFAQHYAVNTLNFHF